MKEYTGRNSISLYHLTIMTIDKIKTCEASSLCTDLEMNRWLRLSAEFIMRIGGYQGDMGSKKDHGVKSLWSVWLSGQRA